MDQKLIYSRSPAGEEALAQRTRIVQRNLRNALDLVDGKRTVGEISKKFGDAAIAEAALADLHRSGFIETAEGRRAREAGETSAPLSRPPDGPPGTGPEKGKKKPNLRVEAFGEHLDDEDITIMDPLDFPMGTPETGQAQAKGGGAARAPWEDDEELAELARGGAPPEYKPPVFTDDEAAASGAGRFEKASRPRSWGRLLKYVGAGVTAFVVLSLGVIAFFPYDRYLPRVELKLRSSAGEPVRLGNLRFSFDPKPSFTLEKLTFGEDGALTIGVVKAVPDFSSLFSTTKSLSELHLRQLEMDARALPRFAAWINGGVLGERYFVARSLRFSDLKLKLGDVVVEGLGGQVVLDGEGKVSGVRFISADGTLSGELAPGGSPQKITFSAAEWKMPGHDWIQLNTLEAQGVVATGGLRIEKFDARAFDGIVAGTVLFNWAQGGEFVADVELRRVSTAAVVAKLRPGFGAQGELSGRLKFVGSSTSVANVISSVAAEGDLAIQRGVLQGLDFAEAVRSRNPGPTRGGHTRFEQLATDFVTEGRTWRLTNLSINAGLMRANGALTIGEEDIAGSVQVRFEGVNPVAAPVVVSGTVVDPRLTARR